MNCPRNQIEEAYFLDPDQESAGARNFEQPLRLDLAGTAVPPSMSRALPDIFGGMNPPAGPSHDAVSRADGFSRKPASSRQLQKFCLAIRMVVVKITVLNFQALARDCEADWLASGISRPAAQLSPILTQENLLSHASVERLKLRWYYSMKSKGFRLAVGNCCWHSSTSNVTLGTTVAWTFQSVMVLLTSNLGSAKCRFDFRRNWFSAPGKGGQKPHDTPKLIRRFIRTAVEAARRNSRLFHESHDKVGLVPLVERSPSSPILESRNCRRQDEFHGVIRNQFVFQCTDDLKTCCWQEHR